MKKLLFLLFYLLVLLSSFPQPDLNFMRYTTEQGLLNDDVTSICQDHHGFIWFGTKKGASRFDGMEFKNYVFDKNDSLSIGQGWVNEIIRDNNNNLWFALAGSTSTFMKYDDEKDVFIDISSSLRSKLHITDKNFSIWNIHNDNKGIIWLTYSSGVIQYDPKRDEIYNMANSYQKLKEILATFIRVIYEDNDDNLWLAGTNGISVYNKKSGLITRYINDPQNPNSLSNNDCYSIYSDSDKNIWIGTYNGLNKLRVAQGGGYEFEVFNYNSENPLSLSGHFVYDIEEDTNKNLLIATTNGLSLFDKKEQKIYRYYHDEIDKESINANTIRKIFRDMQGNIWLATSAGVAKLTQKNFHSYSSSSYKNSISHNRVQYLTEDVNSELWISTSKGIDIYNPKTGKFRFFAGITRNSDGLYGDPLVTSTNSNNKGMLIGTWGNGFSYYNYSTKKFHNYIVNNNVDFKNVFNALFDSKNNFWICNNKNIYVYNPDSKKEVTFKHEKGNENTLSSNIIHYLIEDSESDIWIGTNNGLNMLADFKKGIFKHYIKGLDVFYITESIGNVFWLSTNKGLYRFHKKTNALKIYNRDTVLPDATIYGILEDESHNLWISTEMGISRLKFSEDSITEVVTYRKEEGVNIGNCLPRVCTKLVDGSMAFGGSKGFCLFRPETIQKDTLPPSVVFTDLTVSDKVIKPGDEINGQVLLQKSLRNTNSITLNHKNNAFVIGFVGIQYHLPQYIKYAYRLDGYDKSSDDWHYTDFKKRKVEYMNLPAGKYTFKVKAANSYGIWNDKPAVLLVDILPPWWKTIWFSILYIILLIFSVIVIIKVRTYNLQKQKRKLEIIVKQRTFELTKMNVVLEEQKEELEQQMNEMEQMNKEVECMAQKLHEADESKLRFFANISHEFRTPLTLIIGPLEKFTNLTPPINWEKLNIHFYHKIMHKNAKRLLRLINQVIDFRRMEKHEMKLQLANNDIVDFIEEIVNAFMPLAEQKNIQLRIKYFNIESNNGKIEDVRNENTPIESEILNPQFAIPKFYFDADVMEKILYNLISNAIKYTPEAGSVTIELHVKNHKPGIDVDETIDNNKLNTASLFIIKVSDTGIGINSKDLSRIFDRFYRVDSNDGHKNEGTGIGLSYTKELVELHKGSITVESEPEKGTIFIVSFPIPSIELPHDVEELYRNQNKTINLDYIRSMVEDETKEKQLTNSIDQPTGNAREEKQTILIVEDNADLRYFIKSELESQYIVVEAENGEKGLETLIDTTPDIIISDIMMPVMDGLELCTKIKTDKNTSHIPVILITAKSGEEAMFKGLKNGADDYLAKPFNISILKIKIENLFIQQKRLQEKFSQSLYLTPSDITCSDIDEQFIKKAIQVVKDNMNNYDFNNDNFIDHMNYGRTIVYTKIKKLTGQSLSEFIRDIRLKTAAQYFLEGNDNISEIAYRVGFSHPNNLTKYFTKKFGKPPREFIKDNLKK